MESEKKGKHYPDVELESRNNIGFPNFQTGGFNLRKPLAVQRRDYIASTGPSIYGTKRMDKVFSPNGELFVFLGVRDGDVYLERENKAAGEPFVTVDSTDFAKWKKQQ